MATISRGQWTCKNPSASEIPAGSIITGGNFAQHTPDTPIMVGRALTIRGGMWRNVRKDANWTIEGGNWFQSNLCSHNHPHLVQYGLTECAEACSHSEAHQITIDGETITEYEYTDEVL